MPDHTLIGQAFRQFQYPTVPLHARDDDKRRAVTAVAAGERYR